MNFLSSLATICAASALAITTNVMSVDKFNARMLPLCSQAHAPQLDAHLLMLNS